MQTIGPLDAVVVGFMAIVLGLLPGLTEGTETLRDLLSHFYAKGYQQADGAEGSHRVPAQLWFVVGGFALILVGLLDYFFKLSGR